MSRGRFEVPPAPLDGDLVKENRLRSVCRRVLSVAVRVCVAALLLEGTFRLVLWWSQKQPPVVVDETKGWRMAPGAVCRVEHADGPYLLKMNSRGERDRLYPYSRQPGRRRIVVLGGSNAFGIGVPQEDTFTEILERRLGNVDVINLACVHYDLDQQYVTLEEKGMLYEPDLVLQSISETAGQSVLSSPDPEMKLPKCWVSLEGTDGLVFHTPSYPWWLEWTRACALLRVADFAVFRQATPVEPPPPSSLRWEAVRRLLMRTRSLAESRNARYLAAYTPLVVAPVSDLRDLLQEMSDAGDIAVLDLSVIHDDSLVGKEDRPELIDAADWHFTEYAHYVLAEQIEAFLKNSGF